MRYRLFFRNWEDRFQLLRHVPNSLYDQVRICLGGLSKPKDEGLITFVILTKNIKDNSAFSNEAQG